MHQLRFVGALTLMGLVSCGGTVGTGTSSAPVPPPAVPADFTIEAFANAGIERDVLADFWITKSNCSVQETVGGCIHSTCPKALPTVVGAGDPGTLTVSSPSLGTPTLTLMGGYGRVVQGGVDYAANEPVSISGTGGADIPAFATSVVVPAPLTDLTLGSCTTTGTGCSLSAAPLTTWTGAQSGDFVRTTFVNYFTDTSGGGRVDSLDTLTCTFSAASGSGQVPAEAWAKLRTGELQVTFAVLSPSQTIPGAKHTLEIFGRRVTFEFVKVQTGG
jgi:hypothetical protein